MRHQLNEQQQYKISNKFAFALILISVLYLKKQQKYSLREQTKAF